MGQANVQGYVDVCIKTFRITVWEHCVTLKAYAKNGTLHREMRSNLCIRLGHVVGVPWDETEELPRWHEDFLLKQRSRSWPTAGAVVQDVLHVLFLVKLG